MFILLYNTSQFYPIMMTDTFDLKINEKTPFSRNSFKLYNYF